MKFQEIEITVGSENYTLKPYDYGANGAFVFRYAGVSLNAHRVAITAKTDDAKTDRYTVVDNIPRVCTSAVESCMPDPVLGSDLVKTELRFLATTSKVDRELAIDQHIALLQELRTMIADREVVYG